MKRRAIAALALGLALPVPAAAESQTDIERAKESFRAGAAAYAAGEYLAAIQALEAAYDVTPLPAIAFSLAQAERRQYFVAHERGHLERAVSLYRLYVDQVPSGGRRADALEALSQLEPLAARTNVSGSPTPGAALVRRTLLLIRSDAPEAKIALDGAAGKPSPLIREVEPGKHRVSVEAPGFFSAERSVMAVAEQAIPETIQLRERPTTLGISTDPGAELYMDGAFVSEGGSGVVLQLPSGEHHLAVARKGHRVALRTLHLERGKTQSLSVQLEPTRQRLAAHVLFISGGAAVGAGILLGALAIRAEDRAEDFLTQHEKGNVSADDLIAYNAAVTNRDRYRLGATISMASALGLFVTGLFLYQLDDPRAQDLYRRSRSGQPSFARKDRTASSHIAVTPLVAPGRFGALLQTAF
jgi:hypothetical protein